MSGTNGETRTARISASDALIAIAVISSAVFIWLIAVPAFGPARSARHVGHLPMLWAHVVGGMIMSCLCLPAKSLFNGRAAQRFRRAEPDLGADLRAALA
jgi:hypothetical protein